VTRPLRVRSTPQGEPVRAARVTYAQMPEQRQPLQARRQHRNPRPLRLVALTVAAPFAASLPLLPAACGGSPSASGQVATDGGGGAIEAGSDGFDARTGSESGRVPVDAATDALEAGGGPRDGASGGREAGPTDASAGPTCMSNTLLPPDAPALVPGVWTDISPAGVPFTQTDATGSPVAFGQGITLDPCNAGVLYLSVQTNDPFMLGSTPITTGGLFKSVNGGKDWTLLPQLDGPLHTKVDPRDPQHLYVADDVRGTSIGFWISHDGGQTWSMPDGFTQAANTVSNNHAYYIETDPTDFDHVLLSFHGYWYGANAQTGFLESRDGGLTWTIHQPDPGWMGGEGKAIFFLSDPAAGLGDSSTFLCATQESGHWRTTDDGATWTKVTSVTTDHGGNQLYYTKQGILYAGGTPGIMRSSDNGQTWTVVSPGYAAYLSVIGDGVNLYAGNHAGGTFVTAKENDDTNWMAFDAAQFREGPFELAYDSANGIVYSSNISGGTWALKVKR
jgi:photosystem II stability/assembly factor-like uncharacterized protein